MKKSKYALLSLTLVISIVLVLASSFKIDKTEGVIEADNSTFYSCSPNIGYAKAYKTNGNYNVRTGPGTEYSVVTTYNRGTNVTVYCETNGWARISSTQDRYISKDGLDLLAVTVSAGNIVKTPATFYRNKSYSGSLSINVSNLPNDGASRLTFSIEKNGIDKKDDFSNVTSSYSNGRGTFSFSRDNSSVFGTYDIVVRIDGSEKARKSFTVEKDEFDFNVVKYTDKENIAENEQGEWIFTLTDLIPLDLTMEDFEFTIKKGGEDASDLFTTVVDGGRLVVKNKKREIGVKDGKWQDLTEEYAQNGTYTIEFTLADQSEYSSIKGFKRSHTINIERKRASIAEDATARRYTRYQIDFINEDYNVDVIGKIQGGGIVKYVIDEHISNETNRVIYSAPEMRQIYPNIRLDAIYFEARAAYYDEDLEVNIMPVGVNFGNSIYITNYSSGNITYFVTGSSETITVDEATFEIEYPSAYQQLKTGGYKFSSTGAIMKNETGEKTKIVKKIVAIPNMQPFAVTGGEIGIAAKISGFTSEELEGFKADLTKLSDNKKLVETDGDKVYDPNFSLTFDESAINQGYIYITMKYSDTSEAYADDYRIRFGYNNLDFSASFKLEDGKIDYTIYSEADGTSSPTGPMTGRHPGANQKYNYYVGLYLKKARVDYYGINLDAIGYRIFDKRVDKREDGSYYFYDEIEYITKVKRIANNKVYFDLSVDNGETYTLNQELPLATFATDYSEAYEYFKDYTPGATKLKYYNLDANGNIISDNYSMHPVRMYAATEDATDMTLDYIDEAGTNITVLMDTAFKRANVDMYGLIATRFGYANDGSYVLGAIRGRRRINIENNDDLDSHDVSDLFFVKKAARIKSVGDNTTEDDVQKELEEITKKTLTILPKSEVPAGQYFVYVSHELESIGYIYDDDSDDSAIELAIYPELKNRNNHMTSITYDEPIYNVSIDDPIKTNTVNNMSIVYANVQSSMKFNMSLEYIYDTENFGYKIEYKNSNGSWIDASDYFYTRDEFHASSVLDADNYETRGLTDSTLELITKPGTTKKGEYRLVFEYSNNGITMSPVIKEFAITSNNYGISIDPDEVVRLVDGEKEKFETFYSNQKYDIQIPIHLYTVDRPENLEFELTYQTGDEHPWIPGSKEFRSYHDRNIVTFKYNSEVSEVDEDEKLYLMNFSNYSGSLLPQALEGKYVLKVKYQEEGGELAEASFNFVVSTPKREFKAVEEKDKAVSNPSEMYIVREIESSYIVGSRLESDEISYSIEMYKDGRYVDVSNENSDTRYFEINMKWKDTDVIDKVNYYGDMKINLAIDKVERIFEISDEEKFMLVITLGNVRYELPMPNIRELFKWNIEDVNISGELINDGEKVIVSGYYNNAKPQLDIKLKTPHEENAKFAITQECSGNVCTPSEEMINYNDRFDIITHTNDRIIIKEKENLSQELKLKMGKYQVVVYYSQTDYDIYDFIVRNEYVSIEFGEKQVETPVKGGVSNDLFINKDSVIKIPVNIIGASYDNVSIDISNNNQSINYNHLFDINKDKFISDHILEITYDSKKEIEAQDYLVMVHKTVDGEIIEDHEVLKFNATYFNYMITDLTYDPDPAVPNYENGGKIIFDIMTDELMTGDPFVDGAIKREFLNNLTISHTEIPELLNDRFEITYQDTSDINNFKVILRYSPDNQISPGNYTVTFNAAKNSYSLQKKHNFFVDTFERRIVIDGVTINSNTKDELIHRNTGGIYFVNYHANYEIDYNNLYVKVVDNEDNDYTDKFVIDKTFDGQVSLNFDPSLHTINYGIYKVILTYADPVTHRDNIASTDIIMYGDYKEISIKDMVPSTNPIIAENEGQYYDFTLDTSNLTEEEVDAMKIRIYDSEDNVVYSNVNADKVTNAFEVIKTGDDSYRVNILPYKARVGSYFVEFILPASFDPNNLGLQNVSNKLEFTIDRTLYNVKLTANSKIETQDRINDTDDIYDFIGVNGSYEFTSDSPFKDEYSIKVFNKLKLVKEISVDASNVDNLENIKFSVDEISNGDVEFALCIKGLPYVSITKEVLEYIRISEFALVLDHKDVEDELTLDTGDVKTFDLVISPQDATNKNLIFTSSDENVATFNGSTITVKGSGEATIIVSNKEISKTFVLKISERLDSNTYIVDQNEKTIFVNHMYSTMLSKNEFIRNIQHLKSDYKILDKNNVDVTTTTDVIGTDFKIVNGNFSYTVIVVGDVNGDGIISLVDATQVFRYYRGYINLSGARRQAAIVTQGAQIRLIDATNLYRFYRGDRSEL